jgi:polysaccharide export outer membrane protein
MWQICLVLFLVVTLSGGFPLGPLQADAVTPAEQPSAKAPPVDNAAALEKHSLKVTSEYYIGPEDVLEIIVWKNAELSKVVAVRPDGRISLPLLGDIDAIGLTPAQLTANIVSKLKQYKETPTVSVILQQVNSYGIYVLGEVAQPGRFFLKSKTTLLQAITGAGGFTPTAARNKIVVFRWDPTQNKEIKLKASYDDIVLRDSPNQNLVLKPGDTLVIPSETMVMTQ